MGLLNGPLDRAQIHPVFHLVDTMLPPAFGVHTQQVADFEMILLFVCSSNAQDDRFVEQEANFRPEVRKGLWICDSFDFFYPPRCHL